MYTLTIESSTNQLLYICSQEIHHQPEQVFRMHLYAHSECFEGIVFKDNLNKQLNWNHEFFQNLSQCLSGENKNLIVNFDGKMLTLMTCVANSKIKVTLFEVQMERKGDAFTNMRHKLKYIKNMHEERKHLLQQQQQHYTQEIEEIRAVKDQLHEKGEFQQNYIKNSFLPLINEVKKKARTYSMEEEVEEDEEDESRTARKVYSVKPELENSAEKNLRSVNDDFINLFK